MAGTNLANHNVTTLTTYALYREQFAYGRVDGKYASVAEDLRIVMGGDTYAHASSQYRGNNDNMDALMSLMAATGGVKVSAPTFRRPLPASRTRSFGWGCGRIAVCADLGRCHDSW